KSLALFITQRLRWVQLRSAIRGYDSKYHAHNHGERKSKNYRDSGDRDVESREEFRRQRTGYPEEDTREPSDYGHEDCFRQELIQNVLAASPDRHLDAYFSGPLRDRHQHDVHDSNAGDDKRDR